MKKLLLLVSTLVLLGSWQLANAQCTSGPYPDASPAPDNYGYTWVSDTAPGAPAFNWIDIEQPANEVVGLTDDNFVGPISMGLDFDYYWNTYSELYIGSNGYVMFGTGRNVASNANGFPVFPTSGPASSPNNFIGALLCDLTFTDVNGDPVPDAKCYQAQVDDSTFVVTFKNVPYWSGDAPLEYQGQNTFQVVFNNNSGNITLNYQSVDDSVYSGYIGSNFVTRGIENITGDDGLCIPSNVYPGPNSSVTVQRPGSSTFEITDVQVDWIIDESNQAQVGLNGQSFGQIQCQVRNAGTEPISQPFNVQLRAFDYLDNSSIVLQDTAVAPSLQPGQTAVVTFSETIDPNQIQNLRVRARTLLAGDEVNGNNERNIEFSVFDTNAARIYVGYDRFMFSEYYGQAVTAYQPTVDGSAGGLKIGTYIEPPFYPAMLETIDLYMWFTDTDPANYNGFIVEVFEDVGGEPAATPFFVDSVDKSELNYPPIIPQIVYVTQEVELDTPLELTSGEGVWVSYDYIPTGDTLFNALCTDEDFGSPKSFRTYEITGGVWAPYRAAEEADFAIRAGFDKSPLVSRPAALNPGQSWVGNAYPNPANGVATIPVTLEHASPITITVRNVMGQQVYNEQQGKRLAGDYELKLNTNGWESGVYLYTVTADGQQVTRRLVVSE